MNDNSTFRTFLSVVFDVSDANDVSDGLTAAELDSDVKIGRFTTFLSVVFGFGREKRTFLSVVFDISDVFDVSDVNDVFSVVFSVVFDVSDGLTATELDSDVVFSVVFGR